MKESNYGIRNNPIFRETFNSPDAVKKNGGTATAVDFINGRLIRTSDAYNIVYSNFRIGTSFTARFRVNLESLQSYTYFFRLNEKAYVRILDSTFSDLGITNFKSYIDGVENSNLTTGEHEIVITGTFASARENLYLFSYLSTPTGSNSLKASTDLVEFYDTILTASQVKMLYDETLNTDISNNAGYNTAGVLTNAELTPILEYDFVKNKSAYNKVEYGDELVTNGDFNTDSSWTYDASDVDITGGKLVFFGTTSSTTSARQSVSVEVGKKYIISFDITDYTSGTLRIRLGGEYQTGSFESVGNYSITTTCTATGTIQLQSLSNFLGSIDNVSLKEINNDNQVLTDCTFGQQGLIANGSTTKLDTGSTADLTGDITIEAIINPASWNAYEFARLLDNGKLILGINSDANQNIFISSNGVTVKSSANSSISLNIWQHVLATRAADGTTNIYIDNTLSGTANQTSGTPGAGTTNTFIGNRDVGDRTFNGALKVVNAYSGIMTLSQTQKRYNYWKNRGYLQ